ncbi:sugar phosphate isomerase/epimerase family protein [Hymenobacter sp. PAMC 26628]|uniref:sugar phosphate isomerase/epimerase family protein n=1 Tax=Hymenobacter sp. PAMC 26628 TaxID=1484118 RepID=UPI0007702BC9|nr:sugar phosphate isomerase/epimerase [Hymenobacter sp. PAMC 26628]AMJ66142.1 xylose isomerase [Hymenobacter sp. PAMC 26628]
MTQRRDFLKQAGILSALSLVNPGALLAAPSTLKAGLQLYTLRDYIGKDAKGVLAKVGKAGYKEVETYGYSPETHYWGLAPKEFKAVLAANGLTTPSGHYDMGAYLRDGNQEVFKAYMAAANACGQQYIVVPYLDAALRKTTDDFKMISEKLNKAGELCKAAGLRLGYHNHDFEFQPVNGVALYDVMLKETDARLVDFEMDIYWVVRAGRDPIKLIEANPKRFPMWHIKDMEKAQPEHNTEIGSGTIDFKKIIKYAKTAGLQHPFMEQEYFAMDAYQSITQSAAYMKKNLLS